MSRVLFAYVALLCAVASFGVFLNDEHDQAAAFWNLAHGSLLVKEIPPGTYLEGDNLIEWPRYGELPVASTPLNVLALAVLPVVLALDAVAPLQFWFAGLFCWSAWKACGLPAPWRGHDALTQGLRWAALAGLVLVSTGGLRSSGLDVRFFQAIIAVQVTNMLVSVAAAALLWHLLGRRLQGPGRGLAFFATILGSWLFWAEGLKYHMLSALVVLGVLALLDHPPSRRRAAAVGALTGLAIWVNVGVGATIVAALGLFELGRLVRQVRHWRTLVAQWGLMVASALLALVPMFIENQLVYGTPFFNFYLAGSAEPSEGVVDATTSGFGVLLAVLETIFGGVLHPDFAPRLLSILTTGHLVESRPFGIFALTPFLAASVVGAWRVVRAPARRPAETWALCLLAAQALLLTNYAVFQGGGFDVRLWFHVLPGFALLAALGCKSWLDGLRAATVSRGALIAFVVVVACYALLFVLTANGYKISLRGQNHAWTFLQAMWVVMALVALAGSALAMLRWRADLQPASVAAVVFQLGAPMAWSALLLVTVHTSLPDQSAHPGAGMVLPGMDVLSTWLERHLFPTSPQPITYDEHGNLFFHPDYGRCDADPNPCPESLRRAPWASNTTATAS